MSISYIDKEKIEKFSFENFHKRWPYAWFDFEQFLLPESFQILYRDFPALEFFEYHQGIKRYGGQRPHDRYYLAYESSIYHDKDKEQGAGIVRREDLKESWQGFMDELESPFYKDFIRKALDADFQIRYAWHMGKSKNEVSPHADDFSKVGTHIFYFNTKEDWNQEWGGSLLVLGGKMVPGLNPDFDDFTVSIPVKNMDNHSFLFKNGSEAWHGVKALSSPEGKFRKLFNVIFEKP
jgi:hypothetical protein